MTDVSSWLSTLSITDWISIATKLFLFIWAIISTIVSRKRKVRQTKEKKITSFIMEDIKNVEKIYKEGETKLIHVLMDTEEYCKKIKAKFSKFQCTKLIEELLEVPQKKMEVNPYEKQKNDQAQR